jgi:hypothetical protein
MIRHFKPILASMAILLSFLPSAWADTPVEETGKLTQSINGQTTFEIKGSKNLGGSIAIISRSGSQLEVNYKKTAVAESESQAKRFLELIDVKMQTSIDNTIVLTILTPSDSPWEGSDYKVSLVLEIQLPEKMKIQADIKFLKFEVNGPFDGVDMKADFSSVFLSDINGGVNIATSFAPIKLENITGSVKAETRFSSIEASDITIPFGSAIFQNNGGPIGLRDIQGPVEAYTTHSSIQASDIDAAEGSMVFRTSYSPISISNVKGELICETSFSPVTISDCNLTHGQSKIETSYSPINADIDLNGGGKLFIYNNYSNINLNVPSNISSLLVVSVDDGGRIRTSNLAIKPTALSSNRLEGKIGRGQSRIELKVVGIGTIQIEGR